MANDRVRIAGVAATVEGAGIIARFRLEGGAIDAQWQGAFARAIEGSLAGMAKRWHVDRRTVVVHAVEPGRGADVAAAVHTAVEVGNDYVTQQAQAAETDRAERALKRSDLERAATEAEEAMRARLAL